MAEKVMSGKSSKKTLSSGMMSTAIDVSSLCRIIKECGRSGVRKFKYRELEIEFSSEQLAETPKTLEPQAVASAIDYQNREIAEPPRLLLNSEDREILEAFDEVQLAIDDPLAYENAQIGEDLEAERVRGISERTEDRGPESNVHGGGGR